MWSPTGAKPEAAVTSPTNRVVDPRKPSPVLQPGSADNPINLSPDSKRREVGQSRGKIHKCSECDKVYTTSMGLYYHMQHHTGTSQFKSLKAKQMDSNFLILIHNETIKIESLGFLSEI